MYQNRFDHEFDDDCKCSSHEEENKCDCDCGCGCNCECECEDFCEPECCLVGPTGPMGSRGAKGPQGPRGLQGQQGKEGLQGLRGPQGITGPQGCPGIQGVSGVTGSQGIQGPRGIDGIAGPRGVEGPQGIRGNTGATGQSAPEIHFASASLTSFTDKEVCPGEAMVFDVGNIQSGFTISDDYQSLIAKYKGTYIVEFGCLVSNLPCMEDALALELNGAVIIEESRMGLLCENMFVRGSVMVELNENESIHMVCDGDNSIESCSNNHMVNAFLIIYQIR